LRCLLLTLLGVGSMPTTLSSSAVEILIEGKPPPVKAGAADEEECGD